MKNHLSSKLAIIFGVTLFIISCGTVDIIGICASALLAGFGAESEWRGHDAGHKT